MVVDTPEEINHAVLSEPSPRELLPYGLLPDLPRSRPNAFARYGETIGSISVKDIMRYGVTTVSPDESVNRVMNLMTHHRVRHMPVLRDGRLAGIISIGDVVKHRLEDLELETNVLRDAYNAAR
jgi:CBS domain-containing protein